MSKALEALNNLKNRALQDCDFVPYTVPEMDILAARERMNEKTQEEYAILEKQLKAFEIIKESICDISVDYWEHLDRYTISLNHYSRDITKEEYELMKEVLS